MGNVNADGIWTPDEDDTLEPDVWSAQMADSISQGLGVRMARQETRAGLSASVAGGPFNITGAGTIADTGIILPVQRTGYRNYITNMELVGGVATVKTPGLYLIVLTATADFGPTVPIDLSLWLGNTADVSQPFISDPEAYANATITSAHMLDVGDTIYGRLRVGAGRSDTVRIRGANLRVTLLYATAD
jgi:hypothetical protein